MNTIHIEASNSYDVIIGSGLLKDCGQKIRSISKAETAFVVADDTVFKLYGRQVVERLQGAGFIVNFHVFNHGEQNKNLRTYTELLERLCASRITRTDIIVALGGGVCGDMAGFAAATYQRGMDFVQIPTTLLAAVDSSVGGKTAVDLEGGKNMVGAFHQPRLVLCDTDTFATLPEEEFTAGSAEVIKYAVLGSSSFFDELKAAPIQSQLEHVITTCVSMKRDYVAADEFDRGLRTMLNLGHTIGHAAEKAADFSILHGQGVAMGMAAIARAAAAKGICTGETRDAIIALLRQYKLPVEVPYSAETIRFGMLSDKKMSGSRLKLVVPESIGHCRVETISADQVPEWLTAGGLA
ncbi:MAG: 3-dehydroquinate synthase [Oscillospiraceae bacterium]|nr:3-dehydroquinate synthase [Oscillospiraceae bacterium]